MASRIRVVVVARGNKHTPSLGDDSRAARGGVGHDGEHGTTDARVHTKPFVESEEETRQG
jgi:hypothetical protein